MYLKEIADRIWSRVIKDTTTGCWNWQGALTNAGYGSIRIDGKGYYTHRVVFEISFHTITDDSCVIHKCDNTRCCNHDHLALGTHADNMADMAAKGRSNGGGPSGSRQGSSKLKIASSIRYS